MDQDVKRKALDEVLKQIEKDFDKNAVVELDDPSNVMSVKTTPAGLLSLNLALRPDNIPKGRVIKAYGSESSGKATVALHVVAEVQGHGGITGFIDAEHALDSVHIKNIGIDVDSLYISQPDVGEQTLETTEAMVRSGAVDVIIADSVAVLVPKAEIKGDMGDLHADLQACLVSQAFRKLTSIISNTNSTVVFVNQLRKKIGVMFGNLKTTTGGRALKSYSPVRLDARRIDALKQGGEIVSTRVRVKVVKSKITPSFEEIELDTMLGKGTSKKGDILDLAVKENIVEKNDTWFSYEDDKIGQGREDAKNFLHGHPTPAAEIENHIREARGLAPIKTEVLPEGAEFTLLLTEKRGAE